MVKKINLTRKNWQQGFQARKGIICPYCGMTVPFRKPWGIATGPSDEVRGLLIFNCRVCHMPVLKPRKVA